MRFFLSPLGIEQFLVRIPLFSTPYIEYGSRKYEENDEN